LEVLVQSLKGFRAWKSNEQMSVDVGKNHRTQNSQKTQKKKVSGELVPL